MDANPPPARTQPPPAQGPGRPPDFIPTTEPQGANPVAIQPPYTVATTGERRPVPALNARQLRYYMALAEKLQQLLIKDWVPHIASPAERLQWKAETQQLLTSIKTLETEKDRIAPRLDGNIETTLFMARVDYRVKFARLFRFEELPNEIVCNIFALVCWSITDTAKSIEARLWLTWTCRHWRKIALNDTTLWNVIWWRDPPIFSRSMAWLERAGHAPKDVRISDEAENPMKPEVLRVILDRLIPRISTVRCLILILHEWDSILLAIDQLRAIRISQQPMTLQRFELHRAGPPWVQLGLGYNPGTYRVSMPLFGGLAIPSLRNLSLSGVHVDWANSPLANLTILDLRKIPMDRAPSFLQFRAILSESRRLYKLILDGAGPNFDGRNLEEINFPPILLPELRSLALADFSVLYGIYLISQISAPELRDLTLLNMAGEDYTRFFEAHTGLSPQLRVLTIFNAELQATLMGPNNTGEPNPKARRAVVRWLEAMPKITFLRFGSLHPNFLECFLANPAGTLTHRRYPQINILCPILMFLEWQRMDANIVTEWSKQRKTIGAPLQKMYINQQTAATVSTDAHQALTESLGEGGHILLLRPGHKAPEETSLQDED